MKKKLIITFLSIAVLIVGYFGYTFTHREQWTFFYEKDGAGFSRKSLPSLSACIKDSNNFFNNNMQPMYSCRKNCKTDDIYSCEQIMICGLQNGCAPEGSEEVENTKALINYEKEIAQNRIRKENEQFRYVQEGDASETALPNEQIIDTYSRYSSDGKAVYYIKSSSLESPRRGKVVVISADPQTFKTIADNWAKDKNNVYQEGLIMGQLDPATFSILEGGQYGGKFIKDKSAVYRENIQPDVNRWILKLENADPKTFIALSDFFGKDNSNVYYSSAIINGADPRTFEVLSSVYGKDKEYVYVGTKIKEGADPKTFKP